MALTPETKEILNNADQGVLSNADRGAIGKCISQVEKHWSGSRWLTTDNPYRSNAIKQISEDLKPQWNPNHRDLSEYIAASAIGHCFDGWSYLGRALEAELSGDPDAARHLGYYAELRAAMALLAGDGIGVFDKKHVIVNSRGKCECLPSNNSTHVFTWKALNWWASNGVGQNTLQLAIRPGSLPLRDWLSQYPGSTKFVSTHWLREWGLDISRLANDREARNLASYRPTIFTSPGPTPVKDTLDTITKFWELCEPSPDGGFPVLDRYLLRYIIHSVATAEKYKKKIAKKREQNIRVMLSKINPKDLSEAQWQGFLTCEYDPETPKLLKDASGTEDPTNPNHSKEVLARATLLLRVATGSAANLLRDFTSSARTGLNFWWSGSSVQRRLWPTNNPPDQFSELWQDVEEASGSVLNWMQSTIDHSYYDLWRNQSNATAMLATAERVALWGLRL